MKEDDAMSALASSCSFVIIMLLVFITGMVLFLPGCSYDKNYRQVDILVYEADEREKQLAPDEKLQKTMDEAAEILGFEVHPVSNSGWRLEFIDTKDLIQGRNHPMFFCLQYTRATYNAKTLAHEMGHMLGLDHVDDETNLMSASAKGSNLESWQRKKMKRHAIAKKLFCYHRD